MQSATSLPAGLASRAKRSKELDRHDEHLFVGLPFYLRNILTFYCGLRRIESELSATALGVGFRFAAVLLRRCLEGAQPADLLENALGIQLVLQPLQRAIDGFTFANDHFWHQ
jgi:hypothetical protein